MEENRTIEQNKKLIQDYPFLLPRNVFADEISDDYDYTWTLLDNMPKGWRIAFSIPFCEDLKQVLLRNNALEDYHILQIKEKYGQLRWYDNAPEEWNEHMYAWEYISEHTCIECGEFPVPMRYFSWISPYCDEHAWCNREWSEEQKQELTEENWNGHLPEFITYKRFSKNGEEIVQIDLKPYYQKLNVPVEKIIIDKNKKV